MGLLMITRRQLLASGAVGLVSPLLVPGGVASAAPAAEALAIVTARDAQLDGLSLYQLKRVYLGDKMQGPGGQVILPLNRDPRGAERIGFDRSVLDMSPEQVARYWIDRKIRGQSAAPKAVDPAPLIQRVIARLPGAIGYVRVREVSSDVKVVRVDGKRPEDPGYAIFSNDESRSAAGFGVSFV
jgi:hypothetical protein